ncbi:DUF1275 domain-containing protein [Weissella muntiaci]|uniref:DUF1275 domain-containing protein n=1 Tax=Weissella muntiaci TaxID=2508881 RepID=A0A6C2CC50_9LACO|nr:YoaK family protein [Weissella muntiaci]TYC51109.1 DUF1275 domain-containing protein [Weissella muntiaci]
MDHSFHERQSVGLILSLIGGSLDGYTFIHYGAFASAQTGNLVLAIIQASDGDWINVGKKLLSTLAFLVGIVMAKHLIRIFSTSKIYFWRLYILYFEAVIFFLLGFANINRNQVLVTTAIAFTAAIQWVTFDKIDGIPYTNLFTTGNLKSLAINFYDMISEKNEVAYRKFLNYALVIAFFISGVIIAVFTYKTLGIGAIQIIAVIALGLALRESYKLWRFQRLNNHMLK